MPALQHGFTVEPTDDANLNRVQQRIKLALEKLAALATTSQLIDRGMYVDVGTQHLQNEARGKDVASATSIPVTGAYANLTGATTIDFIAIAGTFDGFRVELRVVTGLTLRQNIASPPTGAYPLHMITGANVIKAAGSVIAFRRDDFYKAWRQLY
jgi:hypothetical protein